jgi:hypothetical protein
MFSPKIAEIITLAPGSSHSFTPLYKSASFLPILKLFCNKFKVPLRAAGLGEFSPIGAIVFFGQFFGKLQK